MVRETYSLLSSIVRGPARCGDGSRERVRRGRSPVVWGFG